MTDDGQGHGNTSGNRNNLGVVATVLAVALVAAYIVFLALQWRGTGAGDSTWSRRQELLTGIEALAFSGAGALLGTTVQREATRKAEARASQAQDAADRNERDAEKGRALHMALEAKASEAAPGAEDVSRGPSPSRPASAVTELLDLARRYDAPG